MTQKHQNGIPFICEHTVVFLDPTVSRLQYGAGLLILPQIRDWPFWEISGDFGRFFQFFARSSLGRARIGPETSEIESPQFLDEH